MNLRLKMGLPEQEATKASRIIILKLEQHGTIGFIVDEVREVVTLSPDQIDKVTYDARRRKNEFYIGYRQV